MGFARFQKTLWCFTSNKCGPNVACGQGTVPTYLASLKGDLWKEGHFWLNLKTPILNNARPSSPFLVKEGTVETKWLSFHVDPFGLIEWLRWGLLLGFPCNHECGPNWDPAGPLSCQRRVSTSTPNSTLMPLFIIVHKMRHSTRSTNRNITTCIVSLSYNKLRLGEVRRT